jgi:signal transduction histidine kinase
VIDAVKNAAEHGRRLVRLRWVAVAGIAAATAMASWLGILVRTGPLYAVAAIMAACNGALDIALRRRRVRPALAPRLLGGQRGRAAVARGARRHLYAAGAFVLFAAVTSGDQFGWLPQHPLWIPEGGGGAAHLAGVLVALGATMAGAVLVSVAAVERLRASLERERSLRATIEQQERLAIIGEVVAGVVHELGTPLNGLRSSFRAFRRDPEGFLKRENIIQLMEEALDRMAAISRRLLTLARTPEIDRRPVSLNDVVRQSLADLAHRVDAAGVGLECRLADPLPLVLADRVAIGEIVTNLVNNAIDAVESGGKILLQTWDGDGMVAVRVSDTGPGIPPAARARLFEPFRSTKAAGKGTGLGLAISKRLAEAHGGTITVDSREGEGTAVTVRLPCGVEAGA